MSENNGGDVLARGGTRATFRTAGSKVTAEQWAAIWEGYNAEGSSLHPDAEKAGDASVNTGTSLSNSTGL